jgi:ABC-type transport system substrate-binding protein
MRRVLALLPLLVLLAACGGGEEDPRHVVLSYGDTGRPYMPQPEEVAKQIANDLTQIGFTVELRKEAWGSILKRAQNGQHQMALMGWSADVADADNFLYVLLDKTNARLGSAQNWSFYTDETVHKLLEEARYTYDPAARALLYRSAQERILADAPMVPLAFSDRIIAHRKDVGPLNVEPTTHPLLRLMKQPLNGRIVFARSGDAVGLDPARVTDGESSNPIEQIYDTLVRYKPGTVEAIPALAESWSNDDARTTWTFKIRAGVKFHDGTPCDVAAVVNAFERQRDKKHKHHFRDDFAFWDDLLGAFVSKVEAGPGEREVVFRLSRPAPAFFVQALGVFAFSIPSPAALDKFGEDFTRNPVGTGPYAFVKWQSGVEIVLARNDGYWDGAPAVKDVLFRKANDPSARAQQLRAGEAQVIDNVDLISIAQLESDPGVVVVKQLGLQVAYLTMQNQKKPFDDPRVRRAVALAIDKNRLIQAGWQGRATPAVTPVPPSLPGHANDLPDYVRDLAKARALLDEALGPKR